MGSTAPRGLFRSLFKSVYLSFNLKKATSGGFPEMNEAPDVARATVEGVQRALLVAPSSGHRSRRE